MTDDRTTHPATGLTRAVSATATWLGSMPAIIGSVVLIAVWALTGPIFGFSDTWQLIINTSTTIITFNMVFVIQNTQNRDARAIQTKLDDILYALANGDDQLMGLEDEPEKAIARAQQRVRHLADAKSQSSPGSAAGAPEQQTTPAPAPAAGVV